ncbi:MAG: hypothetical protein HQM10_24275 [Candidatus Riflebacteria bacterium]|nr:hypothetical protein [Candidatus Riflebacteria bacterium]
MSKSFLLFICFFAVAFISPPIFSSQINYKSPDALKMSLSQVNDPDKNGVVHLNGKIEVNLGEIRDLSIQVFGSPEIKVEPASTTIPQLSPGKVFNFEITVKGVLNEPGKGPSWVKMRAKYIPDFKTLLEHLKTNEKEYPDEFARNELIQAVKYGQEKSRRASQVAGHVFCPTEPKQK